MAIKRSIIIVPMNDIRIRQHDSHQPTHQEDRWYQVLFVCTASQKLIALDTSRYLASVVVTGIDVVLYSW